MKTLEQTEPRIPVAFVTFLGSPGSYYLTQNLTNTVTIGANNVTLDLMGFSIDAASGPGIRLNHAGIKGTCVRNGSISAPQGNGIDFSVSVSNANGRIENLRISRCSTSGIVVGSGFSVRNVTVQGAGFAAIKIIGDSRISGCTLTGSAIGIRTSGSGALIENNRVFGNVDNYNFSAGNQLHLLLCEIPEILDRPCSVKLAGTLTMTNPHKHGITVDSSDVTIDLCGHALVGIGTSGDNQTDGIHQSAAYRNLRIFNGTIRNWKAWEGCGARAMGKNGRIDNLRIENCSDGISVASGYVVSDCSVCDNRYGLLFGSDCVLRHCTANENDLVGILVYSNSLVSACTANHNGTIGIYMGESGSVLDCCASCNQYEGIRVGGDSLIRGNECSGNGTSGILVQSHDCRIQDNNCTDNGYGIKVDENGNFIVKNTASGNSTNYLMNAGSHYRISTSLTGADAWDNFEF